MNSISALQQMGVQPEKKPGSIGQSLNKDDFLSLLVTQLKNQDPLKPSDPTEFTAQLAQFSSLEQLYNINESIKVLDDLKGMLGRFSALSLIDKKVVIKSDTFQFDGHEVELGFRFHDTVNEAAIYLKNDAGQIVNQFMVTNISGAEHMLQWDGKDKRGVQLPSGTFFLSVIGTTEDGKEVQGIPLVESRVTGVDFSDSGNTLLTDHGKIMFSEIFRVNNPTLSDNARK